MHNVNYRLSFLVFVIASLTTASLMFAGQSSQPAQATGSKQDASAPAEAAKPAAAETAVSQIIEKFLARETALGVTMKDMHPLVETYIQNLEKDDELAFHPTGDQYFLGKLDYKPSSIKERAFEDQSGRTSAARIASSISASVSGLRVSGRFSVKVTMPALSA